MNRRRTEGDETWNRLLNWTKGQKASERLGGHILKFEGYISIDPSHPLGGPDQQKDIIYTLNNKKWVAACFFPRGQKSFKTIKSKFLNDIKGVLKNGADGISFITNQEIKLAERDVLKTITEKDGIELELFHLERIAQILDNPAFYGIRLEFLDIEMTKEEQVSFFERMSTNVEGLITLKDRFESLIKGKPDSTKSIPIPLQEIREFRAILNSITGSYGHLGYLTKASTKGIYLFPQPNIRDLRVPIEEIREYADILDRISGRTQDPYKVILGPSTKDLHVPIEEIREYEDRLNRIIEKLREASELSKSLK